MSLWKLFKRDVKSVSKTLESETIQRGKPKTLSLDRLSRLSQSGPRKHALEPVASGLANLVPVLPTSGANARELASRTARDPPRCLSG